MNVAQTIPLSSSHTLDNTGATAFQEQEHARLIVDNEFERIFAYLPTKDTFKTIVVIYSTLGIRGIKKIKLFWGTGCCDKCFIVSFIRRIPHIPSLFCVINSLIDCGMARVNGNVWGRHGMETFLSHWPLRGESARWIPLTKGQ